MFEQFPGTYNFELVGWRWYEKDLGEYKKLSNWPDVLLKAEVTVGYDVEAIKASSNKLLKSEGIAVGIDGAREPFKVEKGTSEKVSLYMSNADAEPRSAVIQASTMYIWHSDNRFPGLVSESMAELNPKKCVAVEPGQDKLVEAFNLTKETWPLGGTGLSELMDVESPPSGIYFIYYNAIASDCALDDGTVAKGGNLSAIMAVEVE